MTALPPPPARKLPGTITREAPPGPEMTREQFELAVEDTTQDAARWRYLRMNFSAIFTELLDLPASPSGAWFKDYLDARRLNQ